MRTERERVDDDRCGGREGANRRALVRRKARASAIHRCAHSGASSCSHVKTENGSSLGRHVKQHAAKVC